MAIEKIAFEPMLKAGVQFGHRASYWNPEMAPYLMKKPYLQGKGKLHIFNLEKTRAHFEQALHFVESVISGRGIVLFVGTKRSAQEVILDESARASMPCMPNRWVGGMLTNFAEIRRTVDYYNRLKETFEQGGFDHLVKKEKLKKERELAKLAFSFDGVSSLKRLPDALFVVDVKKEAIAVKEANKLGIPVIGVVDSNSSPAGIQYIIPGNDDATRAIRFYAGRIADQIVQTQAQHQPPKAAVTPEKADAKKKKASPSEVATKIVTVKASVAAASSKAEKPEESAKAEPAKKKAPAKKAEAPAKKTATKKPAAKAAKPEAETKPAAVKKKAVVAKKVASEKKEEVAVSEEQK